MKKPINTSFEIKKESPAGGRLGTIHFGKKGEIKTPATFPAICIMTGAPSFGRQGSHYKYIKRIMCRDWGHEYFLSEILHFTDYMTTKESLEKWLKKPFQSWMDEMMMSKGDQGDNDFNYERKEKPYEACFFLDSGGFKLLGNMDFSIDKFGFKTNAKSILELQTIMGGDIIASLDYPLPPVEYNPDTLRELQEKSLRNGISLLKELSKRKEGEPKPLAYLAIHGVDYESSRNCTERLLRKIDRQKLIYPSFGFAIGSLVPRRANRALVTSIIKGAKDAIHDHKNGLYSKKPVHAFGMSGDIVPTLAYLGVDTFDSNSFVQSGKNLRYILPHSRAFSSVRATRSLLEITRDELSHCGCRACNKYIDLLEHFKNLSSMKAGSPHELGLDRKYIKSEVYAFLALHGLEIEFREIENIKNEIRKNTLKKYVLDYAEKTNNHGALVKAFEAASGAIVERQKVRKVSITLTRESFAVPETYKPSKEKEILLLIPCTKDKPYKNSRTHEAIRSFLYKDPRIHIVTISGLYGPVPEELEEVKEIIQYDYMLSPQANKQANFIKERLISYLRRYGNSYRHIIAYVTVRAYREVARLALKDYGRGILLPAKPKERTSKEFLKRENIKELRETVGMHLDDSKFLNEQLKFEFG
jgi:7-cyano-7-deazaguanine tRNA-ribosyltransferase